MQGFSTFNFFWSFFLGNTSDKFSIFVCVKPHWFGICYLVRINFRSGFSTTIPWEFRKKRIVLNHCSFIPKQRSKMQKSKCYLKVSIIKASIGKISIKEDSIIKNSVIWTNWYYLFKALFVWVFLLLQIVVWGF